MPSLEMEILLKLIVKLSCIPNWIQMDISGNPRIKLCSTVWEEMKQLMGTCQGILKAIAKIADREFYFPSDRDFCLQYKLDRIAPAKEQLKKLDDGKYNSAVNLARCNGVSWAWVCRVLG